MNEQTGHTVVEHHFDEIMQYFQCTSSFSIISIKILNIYIYIVSFLRFVDEFLHRKKCANSHPTNIDNCIDLLECHFKNEDSAQGNFEKNLVFCGLVVHKFTKLLTRVDVISIKFLQ